MKAKNLNHPKAGSIEEARVTARYILSKRLKFEDVGSIDRIINISKDPNTPEFVHFIEIWDKESRTYYINGEKVSKKLFKIKIKG